MKGIDSAVFDMDDVVIVTKDGLHKNTPVVIKGWHIGKPWDIYYDCETTDEPSRVIVVNEKDLISFDEYLEDMDLFDMDDEDTFKDFEDFIQELDFDPDEETLSHAEVFGDCECGSEKAGLPTHSHWCPKYG